jgi:hypothetical protein
MNKRHIFWLLFVSTVSNADGLAIDKVYHPYVQPLEKEIEWRLLASDGADTHRFGYGQSINERLFLEGYVIGKQDGSNFSVEAYEMEALIQLTEQGEYAFDWGLLFEIERETDDNIWEIASTLLIEKEINNWVWTGNASVIYETGEDETEFETALAMQLKYRFSRQLEPMFELYKAEDTFAIGPGLMGDVKFSGRKKLHWETGLLMGVDSETPDSSLRLSAEYEY